MRAPRTYLPANHYTPEHGEWCAHLDELGILQSDHKPCVKKYRDGLFVVAAPIIEFSNAS